MTTEQWAAAMVNGNHSMNSFGMPINTQNPFVMSSPSVNPLIHMQSGQHQTDQMLNENIMAAAVSYAVHSVPSTASAWPSQITISNGAQPTQSNQTLQIPSNNYTPPPQAQSPIENTLSSRQNSTNSQQPQQQYKWMQVKRQITKVPGKFFFVKDSSG
jgi:hypothetical protein